MKSRRREIRGGIFCTIGSCFPIAQKYPPCYTGEDKMGVLIEKIAYFLKFIWKISDTA